MENKQNGQNVQNEDDALIMPRLTPKINCLSFDCGISNLCYCLLTSANDDDNSTFKTLEEKDGIPRTILKWENVNLRAQNMKDAVDSLIVFLDSKPWMCDVDHVIIEQQTLVNSKMKCMSHCLQSYFVTKGRSKGVLVRDAHTRKLRKAPGNRGPVIHFISPRSKFHVCDVKFDIKIKDNYRRNKKLAIEMTRYIIKDLPTTSAYFSCQFKKDDLADSFLQAAYFLKAIYNRRKAYKGINKYLKEANTSNGVIDIEVMNEDVKDDEAPKLPHTYEAPAFREYIFQASKAVIDVSTLYHRDNKMLAVLNQ